MMTGERRAALDQIAALAKTHALSIDDIGGVLTANYGRDKSSGLLVRILGYLGATLIFGGLCLLIGMQWDVLDSAARVVITYGPGLAAFVMGVITLGDARYKGASTPLFVVSALLQPTGMLVFLHEYANGDDIQLAAMIVFGLCAFQFLGAFFKFRRTALLFFGYLFFITTVATWLNRVEVPAEWAGICLSVSMLTIGWRTDQTGHRGMAPFWYTVGGIGLMVSTFDLFNLPPTDIILLPLSVAMMFLSVRIRSRSLLTVNTLGLLSLLCYYTDQYFEDIVGWPVALMIMGALLVAISGWAIKLSRKIKENARVVL